MVSIENTAEPAAWFKLERNVFKAGGRWTIAESARLDQQLQGLDVAKGQALTIDGSKIEKLDSTGAWLLLRTARALEAAGHQVSSLDVPERYGALIKNIDRDDQPEPERKRRGPRMSPTVYRLYRIGKATTEAGKQGWRMLGYLGRVTVETGEMIAAPRKNLRFAAMMHQVEETGINALPIVGLLAFLIGGAVMCYFDLGITIPTFMRQLNEAINVNTLMVGLIKAPVFAFVISLVGCYEGFQVERNAASVGLLTTRSVVESVFLVIVIDAAFSIMFSVLGI